MSLSIIIIVQNSSILEDSLRSAFCHTGAEIIAVDNDATEENKLILRRYADAGLLRLLINKYNEGVAVSRNRAILESKNKLVAIQGEKSISEPDRFEKQLKLINDPFVDVVGCGATVINTKKRPIGMVSRLPLESCDFFPFIRQYQSSPLIGDTLLFRRDTVLQHGGFNPLYNSVDFEISCRLISAGVGLANRPECLVRHLDPTPAYDYTLVKKETQEIFSRLHRRNFPCLNLREDYFRQECFTEFPNDI